MFEAFCAEILSRPFLEIQGRVTEVRSDSVRVMIANVSIGSMCEIVSGNRRIPIEIVGLSEAGHIGMPLDSLSGIRLGDKVILGKARASVMVGPELLGKVIDSTGTVYGTDSQAFTGGEEVPLYGGDLDPMSRDLITEPIDLGVRSINACLSCGRGQRQGIFAGSGVGKSVLLGMIARHTEADVVVIGLIGERGREVREFLERDLGEEGRKKSVVVVETSDRSAVRRVRGAFTATAVAEYYRSRGKNVLLLMDSLTRFAMAQREIGMSAGEPPTTKGYTPSVFNLLAKVVERAGNWGQKGSITGLYTVLVEGDDLEDPIADSVRSLLDGHIVLSRKLANQGHYPAVDVLSSISRTMNEVVSKEHSESARDLKEVLARYRSNEDAIQYGMYPRGSDARIDRAIELEPKIIEFLRQSKDERVDMASSESGLVSLMQQGTIES